MRRRDSMDQVRDMLWGGDSQALIDNAMELLMGMVGARRGAIFTCTATGITLMASRGVDQEALDTVRTLWPDPPRPLASGSAYFGVRSARAYLVLPCLAPDIVGLLYVETTGPMPRIAAGHLATFSGVLGRAVAVSSGQRGVPVALEPGAVSEAERENLIVLLERNEWNISRVARLLGVTRMTVYNRMRRLQVPREHFRKTGRQES